LPLVEPETVQQAGEASPITATSIAGELVPSLADRHG
jgi:hypothetical protein